MVVDKPVGRDMAGDTLVVAHLSAAAHSPETGDMVPVRAGVVDWVAVIGMPAVAHS